jgi:hypothetical protein
MQRPLRAVAALAMGITGAVISTGSAAASCASIPTRDAAAIAAAPVAFVGTVAFTTDTDRTAYFTVDEVWKGPDLAWLTVVHGGLIDEPNTILSVDRTWVSGTRYLVLPGIEPSGELGDNACSATAPYQASFDALRPPDAQPRYGTLLGAAVVVLMAGATAFVVWQARRRRVGGGPVRAW